ncbi:hypothetical protein [Variovorax sp. OV329]|uniref:hypothetical protein n=1 Tax=Variovorax sp. OV329 TaxID=1882825 RepID=UPI0008EAE1C0|nr:hypothetical protein [Variovorax sp. OV329]SFM96309.1 hypothetical protein SAMN05444747_1124 [Variovorax sp. OV329]
MTSSQRSILALALLALAAGAPLAANASGGTKPAATADDGFATAAQKPNGSGVRVRYKVLGTPAVGQPTRIDIVLARVRDPAGATLQLTADPGLQLDASGIPGGISPGEITRISVTVVPQQEGLAYLNVFTTQRGATSSTSIPIQTGAVGAASTKGSAGKLKEAPDGDKILSMPVK